MNLKYSFLMKCLSVRILLAIISKYIPLDYLPYAGYLALLPFIGFTYVYLSGSRQNKGFAGGKVWWNNYRPIHGILYLLASFNRNSDMSVSTRVYNIIAFSEFFIFFKISLI